jgi:hypothetical protein
LKSSYGRPKHRVGSGGRAARGFAGAVRRLCLALILGLLAACVLGANAASPLASGAPASAPLSWSSPLLIDRHAHHGASIPISGISSPSASLCVAVDQDGRVLTSSGQAGSFASWKITKIDDSNLLESVSCPSASRCFAADNAGNVMWSTKPAGGIRAWHRTRISASTSAAAGISCPSASFCLVAGRGGLVRSSTHPTGRGLWHFVRLNYGKLEGVSCPSKSLCVVVDFSGDIWSTTDPTGGRKPWREVANVPTPLSGLYSISCASVSLCVTGNDLGSIVATTNPTAGREAWPTFTVDPPVASPGPGNTITAISCKLPSLCVAVDSAGHAVTSTNPTGGVNAWQVQEADDTIRLAGVSCPSTKLCAAVDSAGQVIIGRT